MHLGIIYVLFAGSLIWAMVQMVKSWGMQTKIDDQKKVVSGLNEKVEDWRLSAVSRGEKLVACQKEVSGFQKSLKKAAKEAEESMAEVKRLIKVRSSLKENVSDLKALVCDAEEKAAKLESLNKLLSEDVKDLGKKLKHATADALQAVGRLKKSEEKIEDLEESISAYKGWGTKYREMIGQLESSINKIGSKAQKTACEKALGKLKSVVDAK